MKKFLKILTIGLGIFLVVISTASGSVTFPPSTNAGYLLVGTSTSRFVNVATGTVGYVLTSGTSGIPYWAPVSTSTGSNISFFASGILSVSTTTTSTTYGLSTSTLFAQFIVNTPLTYSTSTGTFGVTQASSTANGYLSSTDWNTFNNKVSSQWTPTSTGIYYNGGRVGIGTAAPDHVLTVNGNGHFTQGLYVDNLTNATSTFLGAATFGGSVGIGTTTPSTTLYVNGSSTLAGNVYIPNVTSSVLATDANGKVVATTTSGGTGSITTSSAITVNNFPYWTAASGTLAGTSSLSTNASGTLILNTGAATATLVVGTSSVPAEVQMQDLTGSGVSCLWMVGGNFYGTNSACQ